MAEELEGSKILIVDDVPANIKVLAEVLKGDYQIMAVIRGEDVFEAVSSESVDLILLDVMMSGMDGFQVCRMLKANKATQDIPIIFVTSKNGWCLTLT